jgi:AcrR family transcriptional regulator
MDPMTSRKTPETSENTAILDRGLDRADAPRQTQAERRETAERAILEAAKAIVAERGLEELTLNEAGERAGYSRALPAHYFKTRSALLAALADHITAEYSARMRSITLPDNELEALCAIIHFGIEDSSKDLVRLRAFQAIVTAGLSHPELAPLIARLNRQSIDDLGALIRAGRDKGLIRADARPRAEASILLASMRGVLFQWLIDPNHVRLLRVRDSLVANTRKSLMP